MATINVSPKTVPAGRHAAWKLSVYLPAAGWVQGTTTLSVSGVTGVTASSFTINSSTTGTVVLNTKNASTGTLTVSDGTNSGTTTVSGTMNTTRNRRWFSGLRRAR